MKPGLKQISELTGYSLATISNALSGNRSVSPEATARILRVAKETGYYTLRRIHRIKLVSMRVSGRIFDATPFFTPLMGGVSDGCNEIGMDLQYLALEADSEGFSQQLQKLENDIGSAIILLGTEMSGLEYHHFDSCSLPLVTLDYWCPNQRYSGIEINNYDAGYRAASYLIDKGHRLIGYLRGEWRIRAFHDRGRGYRACMHDHELTIPEAFTVTLGVAMDRAYMDMKSYLQTLPQLPTAFFADDDIIALGAIKALQEAGIRVPEDVSVIGFDDLPYCDISSPSLTSMHVPAFEMGRMAVMRMKELLEHNAGVISRTQICATVTERDSVRDLTGKNQTSI